MFDVTNFIGADAVGNIQYIEAFNFKLFRKNILKIYIRK